MATIQEKLSESLGALKKYQDAHGDNLVIHGADTLGRTHTERLVHPYMDGNGRTARFVMNSQLVTAGYPWVVIPVECREEHMAALEKASKEGFVRFVLGDVMMVF